MTPKILSIFTRTPLHVGAGSSVGAIDQPIQRERHTGFPIIPASSLKGTFADEWNERSGGLSPATRSEEGKWLFGSDDSNNQCAGSLLFSEARLLAFPIRSAKGSYAWITCPLMLQRAKRDGVISCDIPLEPGDEQAIFKNDGPLALPENKIVLEDYCFQWSAGVQTTEHGGPTGETLTERGRPARETDQDGQDARPPFDQLANALATLIADELFATIRDRLVILSNGTMSHFVTTACEIAQHVKISDETGTAEGTGLFNQENVPADTLFYCLIHTTAGKGTQNSKTADEAWTTFTTKIAEKKVFQFGGDASTGLGFCSVASIAQTSQSS